MNREDWLTEAVKRVTAFFEDEHYKVPPVRVSVGFPSRGALSSRKRVIGQCWGPTASSDGVPHIFISPLLSEPVDVLSTLCHELVHAIDNCESGHRGNFVQIAKAVGFKAPWTSTPLGEDMEARLCRLADDLPEYPHVALAPTPKEAKKQTTRMIKLVCPDEECGYTVRTTKKWIERGYPTCPNGDQLEVV